MKSKSIERYDFTHHNTIMKNNSTVYIFIDAANLFYGGEKSLGWKIDYKKLFKYLKNKYNGLKIYYYAGIEIHDFLYSILDAKALDLDKLFLYLSKKIKNESLGEAVILLIDKHIKRIKFYKKLKQFGYILRLKPTKIYWSEGKPVKKANCDVDMTLDLVRYMEQYQEAVILSGDGDFAIVLK